MSKEGFSTHGACEVGEGQRQDPAPRSQTAVLRQLLPQGQTTTGGLVTLLPSDEETSLAVSRQQTGRTGPGFRQRALFVGTGRRQMAR